MDNVSTQSVLPPDVVKYQLEMMLNDFKDDVIERITEVKKTEKKYSDFRHDIEKKTARIEKRYNDCVRGVKQIIAQSEQDTSEVEALQQKMVNLEGRVAFLERFTQSDSAKYFISK